MGRYADIKNNFSNLKKATDIFHTIYGNGLFTLDILTNHKTRFYLDYIQSCVKKEVSSAICTYLNNPYEVKRFFETCRRVEFGTKTPIWVCWFQGKREMPKLVKECYENLYQMVDSEIGEIVLITKDNFCDYVNIEPSILKKIEEGKMSYTNFSDLLRVN